MIVYVLTGVTLLAVLLVMWRIAAVILRRFDGSYEPGHQAPRPSARSAAGAARARRRILGGIRRLPGAARRKLTRDLGAEDRITLGLMQRMRAEDTGGLAYGIVAVPQASPAEFPYAAAPLREPEPGTAAAGALPLDTPPPPPELSHDAFRWPQRWHPEPLTPDVPGPEVGTADTRDGDPVTVAGDFSPLAIAAAAHSAIRALPSGEYTRHLEDATAWKHDTQWFTLPAIDADVAAIRDHGDWDAPLSAPREWHDELPPHEYLAELEEA